MQSFIFLDKNNEESMMTVDGMLKKLIEMQIRDGFDMNNIEYNFVVGRLLDVVINCKIYVVKPFFNGEKELAQKEILLMLEKEVEKRHNTKFDWIYTVHINEIKDVQLNGKSTHHSEITFWINVRLPLVFDYYQSIKLFEEKISLKEMRELMMKFQERWLAVGKTPSREKQKDAMLDIVCDMKNYYHSSKIAIKALGR